MLSIKITHYAAIPLFQQTNNEAVVTEISPLTSSLLDITPCYITCVKPLCMTLYDVGPQRLINLI